MQAQNEEARTVAVVPARGGSVGIPRKNLQLLAGKPLVGHAIDLALAHPAIAATYLTTDDREIASIGAARGAVVPFLRPAALSGSDVPLLPVVQHLLRTISLPPGVDTVVLLQPTNPFRLILDLTRALERLWESGADSVVTVSPRAEHPFRARTIDVRGRPVPVVSDPALFAQRQQLPSVYYLDGCVVAARIESLLCQDRFFGEDPQALLVDALSGFDIDTPFDLDVARLLAGTLDTECLYDDSANRRAVVARMHGAVSRSAAKTPDNCRDDGRT